jgi:hypothetical protein
VQTLFIDDIDGSEAQGTVRFGLDGTDWRSLARYVEAARRNPGSRRPGRSRRPATANGVNNSEVWEWAKAQGMDIKERGRIPAELVVKFKAATGS